MIIYKFTRLTRYLHLLNLTFIVLIFFSCINTAQAAIMVNISEGAAWRYSADTQQPADKWYRTNFNDNSWQTGTSEFGYGTSSFSTHLGNMQGNYSTIYVRKEFTITNIYSIIDMSFAVRCDGAFIAYINGMKVISNKAVRANPNAEILNISGFIHELLPGTNLLAVSCSNDSINSSDFSFIPIFKVYEIQGGQ